MYHLHYRILQSSLWVFHGLGKSPGEGNPGWWVSLEKAAVLEKSRIALTHPALEETVWLKRHRAGHRVKPGQGKMGMWS